jgi:hypothetical protein
MKLESDPANTSTILATMVKLESDPASRQRTYSKVRVQSDVMRRRAV